MELPRDLAGTRLCNGPCATYKDLNEANFFRDSDGPNGWSRKCKECDQLYQRERRARIREGDHKPRPNNRVVGRAKKKARKYNPLLTNRY